MYHFSHRGVGRLQKKWERCVPWLFCGGQKMKRSLVEIYHKSRQCQTKSLHWKKSHLEWDDFCGLCRSRGNGMNSPWCLGKNNEVQYDIARKVQFPPFQKIMIALNTIISWASPSIHCVIFVWWDWRRIKAPNGWT